MFVSVRAGVPRGKRMREAGARWLAPRLGGRCRTQPRRLRPLLEPLHTHTRVASGPRWPSSCGACVCVLRVCRNADGLLRCLFCATACVLRGADVVGYFDTHPHSCVCVRLCACVRGCYQACVPARCGRPRVDLARSVVAALRELRGGPHTPPLSSRILQGQGREIHEHQREWTAKAEGQGSSPSHAGSPLHSAPPRTLLRTRRG